MSVVMPARRLIMGMVPTVQRGARATLQQEQPLPHHTGAETRGARPQLPIEHVAEGYVLGRHSTLNRDAASFHTTSTSASGGVTAMAQRAIAEYQSFALLGKGRSVPLHNVDEYV